MKLSACRLALLLGISAGLGLGGCASERDASSGTSNSSQSPMDRYLDDAALTTKVKAALVKDVGAKAATEVSVTTENGVVQLAGFVSSQDDASRAVEAAQKVSGVREVKDDIRLK